jgi:hypothetical protein
MNCSCVAEIVQPNAAPDAPWFPGIVRFATRVISEYNPDCLMHGYMFKINLAADLRYGD